VFVTFIFYVKMEGTLSADILSHSSKDLRRSSVAEAGEGRAGTMPP
jgi:hypothetical protein